MSWLKFIANLFEPLGCDVTDGDDPGTAVEDAEKHGNDRSCPVNLSWEEVNFLVVNW